MIQTSAQALDNALDVNDFLLVEEIVWARIFKDAGMSEYRGVRHAGLSDKSLNQVADCLYENSPSGRVPRLWYDICDYLLEKDLEEEL